MKLDIFSGSEDGGEVESSSLMIKRENSGGLVARRRKEESCNGKVERTEERQKGSM